MPAKSSKSRQNLTLADLAPIGPPVTAEERDQPPGQSDDLVALEHQAQRAMNSQLALFSETAAGTLIALPGGVTPPERTSSFSLARAWYRVHLEKANRPHNTIDSYSYDLQKLQDQIGDIPLEAISRIDVAAFLGEASNISTRKRRLTSLRRFFRYYSAEMEVLESDPTEGFFPHQIALKSPIPLFANEQTDFLAAAEIDSPWSLTAILLMLELGLTRGELLALKREHVDRSDPAQPVIWIIPDAARKRNKERRIGGDARFTDVYSAFLEATEPDDLLFPFGFQAINGMVERVAKRAGLSKGITPQTLRHTFAVNRARNGATEEDLIYLLGLAEDPRNRESVQRYLKLAAPPL